MLTVPFLPIALASALALVALGGSFYEFLVVDPFWPRKPGRGAPVDASCLGRLPLDVVTCGALLTALVAAASLA